ncbi:conjugal transfer protein [Cohnella sp. GCM10020058]|uniref:conjugal transfer protein n=1 Tax=Cohnella sp. GCM10020058 TaxID=3317330 RepID=UPI00362AFDCD
MRVRKGVTILIYVLVIFGAIGGCNVLLTPFRGQAAQTIVDHSGMQKAAEHFVRLYLAWDEPLEKRKIAMQEIAPSVTQYLVSGKQTVDYVESGTPYFSGERGYVDVSALTHAKVENEEIARRYKLTVYFVADGAGGYVIERMPLIAIQPTQEDPRPVMTKEQETAANSIKPTLQVFLPALLSGDLRSVQTLLTDDSQIVPYDGEYKFLGIQDIRVRESSQPDKADYAVDVVLKVQDVQFQQTLSIQVYLWIKSSKEKYYVVRANV